MPMYAIIESGAKQYRVEPNDILEIERLNLPEAEKEVALERVLVVRKDEQVHIGTPFVAGAKVICDCLGEVRAPKVISFKFRRRKASRRIRGHRQKLLRLRVKEIIVNS